MPSERPSLDPHLELRPSPLHGTSTFTKASIIKDETVDVWSGAFVGKREAEQGCSQGKTVVLRDDDIYTVEEHGGDPLYSINHSCDSKVRISDAVPISARHDISISADAELKADYAPFEPDEHFVMPRECTCGSAICRHRTSGQDCGRLDLKQRYLEQFSLLINKRFAGLTSG